MSGLIAEKLQQARRLVRESGVDVWMTVVRETAQGSDPVLPFLIEGGLTWTSALIVASSGRTVAVLGNYDADPLLASGHWDEVVPYVEGIRAPLLEVLDRLCGPAPRIAVNYSESDDKADGLTHGMYLQLQGLLMGTRFEDSLESAEPIVSALRARKTPTELSRIQSAIAHTDRLFQEIAAFAAIGKSEREVFDFVHRQMASRGLGHAWDASGDPIVNTGPDSMVGHGVPSATLEIAEGHVFHVDLGVVCDGYSSDIQRCWYVGREVPSEVERACAAVVGAISAGAVALQPGALGWEVDAAARRYLVAQGYPEYLHAFGHQVGRLAHDGGAILGPRWPRYGSLPTTPIAEHEVYTLELGVLVEGRGYFGLEEMAVVTADGCRFLTERQIAVPLLAG